MVPDETPPSSPRHEPEAAGEHQEAQAISKPCTMPPQPPQPPQPLPPGHVATPPSAPTPLPPAKAAAMAGQGLRNRLRQAMEAEQEYASMLANAQRRVRERRTALNELTYRAAGTMATAVGGGRGSSAGPPRGGGRMMVMMLVMMLVMMMANMR
jgi:hypothetical protein